MRVKISTADRLELEHRTMLFMFLVGLFSLGGAVKIYLSTPDWKGYVGIGISTVIGLLMILMACNSYVVFDKSRGYFEARHRYLHGKTVSRRKSLWNISAIVINQDSILGNILSVVCIRVNKTDLPITMFGSPFPASVHHHATRISRFLKVPLLDKDRLVIESPEDQFYEMVGDLWGDRVSDALLDRIPEKLEDIEESSKSFSVGCPNCKQTEDISQSRLFDPSAYRKFAAKMHHASGNLWLVCQKCNTRLRVSAAHIHELL